MKIMKQYKHTLILSFLCIILINVTSVKAQELLRFKNGSSDQLTTLEDQFRSKLLSTQLYKSCELILVEDVRNIFGGDPSSFTFTILGRVGNFTATKDRESENESPYWDYLWAGYRDA